MKTISIEICEKSDYKKFAEVYFQSYASGEFLKKVRLEATIKRFETEFQNDLSTFYVAKEDGEIIGIGSLATYSGASFISNLGIIPDKQKQGIGNKLFKRMLNDALLINPTIEIFARDFAVEKIMKKNGFKEQFITHMLELDLHDFGKVDYYKIDFNIDRSDSIPQWIYQFDSKAIGYDRSMLLNYLMSKEESTIFYYKQRRERCYAIKSGNRIGPLIATSEKIAFHMITYLILHDANTIIVPEHMISKLNYKFGPITRLNRHYVKMSCGKKRRIKKNWIWGFNSFSYG